MAVERTLCIVKPDAVEKRTAGAILGRIEEGGFKVVALRMTHLSRAAAEGFYAVHRQRPFFGELVEFMTRSPVVIAVLDPLAGHVRCARWGPRSSCYTAGAVGGMR